MYDIFASQTTHNTRQESRIIAHTILLYELHKQICELNCSLIIASYILIVIVHTITSEDTQDAIHQDYTSDANDPNKLAKLMVFGVIATVCFVAPSVDI